MSLTDLAPLLSMIAIIVTGLFTLMPAWQRLRHEVRKSHEERLNDCKDELEDYQRKYLDIILAGKRMINQLSLLYDDHLAKSAEVGCPYKVIHGAALKVIIDTYLPQFINGEQKEIPK